MRMTRLFSQTLREAPADAEAVSHILLVRSGFIRQLGSGIFSYLPLARRTLSKIEGIIREEMNAIGGQEVTMPVVHPADIWKESGRWEEFGEVLGRFKDRGDHDMALAATHEEVVADLVRTEIKSYRQLPQMIYHIQTKWRDEARSRAGLIRVREFTMKDSYSLDVDQDGLQRQYEDHYRAYFRIYDRCGLPTVSVKADVGLMGGHLSHEFMYLTPDGEDTLLHCEGCGYSANQEVAVFERGQVEAEDPLEQERVATPDKQTIQELAEFLGVPEARTAKAVFLMGEFRADGEESHRLIMAVIRGDLEVNELKLLKASGARALRPARDHEIAASGAVAGYASPIGLKDLIVVADESVTAAPNLVAGANEEGYHLRNVNYGRDYEADVVADVAMADDGHTCFVCGQRLKVSRGIEVGNIFQLGTRFSDALGCSFLDTEGVAKPVVMGSYGIGVGRLMASIAEEHHDDNGLVWPVSVAPYAVHLVVLAKAPGETLATGDQLYADLRESGLEVLYDDRAENPGVKFNDADLIGCPLRITVGDRSLKKGEIEVKLRSEDKPTGVPLDQAVPRVREAVDALQSALTELVRDAEYKD